MVAASLLLVAAACSHDETASAPTTSAPTTVAQTAPPTGGVGAQATTTATSSPTTTTIVVTSEPTNFSTPTGNIACAMGDTGARCDIGEHSWEPTPKPAGCPLDWGHALVVVVGEPTGRFLCAGDTQLGTPGVLPYGHAVRAGPVTCTSLQTELTCRTDAGHGFVLSKQHYRLF